MEIISFDEYVERWLESLRQEKVYYNVNGFDSWQKFESQCGSYDSRFVNLRPNLQMSISDELNQMWRYRRKIKTVMTKEEVAQPVE